MKTILFHNENMNKENWLKQALQEDTINEMATKAGISSATAWRQYNNDYSFTAENVILIARAYKKNPVEALVVFGYLREDEMDNAVVLKNLSDANDKELLDEMARRLKEGHAETNPQWNEPIYVDMTPEERRDETLRKYDTGNQELAANTDDNKEKEMDYDPDAGA